ncbi:4616_t:CDS:2, partial [Acaulospora colombiana]
MYSALAVSPASAVLNWTRTHSNQNISLERFKRASGRWSRRGLPAIGSECHGSLTITPPDPEFALSNNRSKSTLGGAMESLDILINSDDIAYSKHPYLYLLLTPMGDNIVESTDDAGFSEGVSESVLGGGGDARA